MKVAILTDTHFGARSDSLQFQYWQGKFYDWFFDSIEGKVDQIWHLGDCFDHRKYVNFQVLDFAQRSFFSRVSVPLVMLVGNHDAFYRSENNIHSLKHIQLPEKTTVISQDPVVTKNDEILFLPWINKANYGQVEKLLKQKRRIVLGHLDIAGFEMQKGFVSDHDSVQRPLLQDHGMVLSGHYHRRSTQGNVTYIGNPYQMFTSDWSDERGFVILDTETGDIETFDNPHKPFRRVVFDLNTEMQDYHNAFVRLILREPEYRDYFYKYVDRVREYDLASIQIQDMTLVDKEVLNEVSGNSETGSLSELMEVIEDDSVKDLVRDLYKEAMNVEDGV